MESEISGLEWQMAPKKELLNKQRDLKSILWLKHNELRDRCMAVLREMDIETLKDDIGIEDFRILNKAGKDLLKFEATRDAAGKDENFPSILIANTHNKSDTLEKKNTRVPSNVIEHAVRNNILIIRTLDLFKLLNLYQEGKIKNEEILEKITYSTGWMMVSQDIEIVQH